MLQAGREEKVDVQVLYEIKDFEGNTISEKTETIAVLKNKTYNHTYPTSNLKEGNYLVGSK
ncbi:MAG: hypothetical protein ABEI74_01230 [Candidatus Pacearchaeota archaeon]